MDGPVIMLPPHPLVSAEWLQAKISAPDVRVVDATWIPPFLETGRTGEMGYQKAHIPGAVFFDIDDITDPDTSLSHMLPNATRFSSKVRKLGLGDVHHIVVYDNNDFFAAARVWWMFRAMGHRDVSVLDGGLRAWLDAGGTTDNLPPVMVERHYTARMRSDLIKTKDQMRVAIDKKTIILDARPSGRFEGRAPEPRAGLRSGHIPGSQNIPASDLIQPDGKLESPDTLHAILGDYAGEPAIATCGSGVSAAIIALARAVLGDDNTAIYDGSWSEWAADPDARIERT